MTSPDQAKSPSLTAVQSRMARAAFNWSVHEAGRRAGVGANTVSRFETGTEAHGSTKQALRAAYEAAGAVFIDDGIGPGVCIMDVNDGTLAEQRARLDARAAELATQARGSRKL